MNKHFIIPKRHFYLNACVVIKIVDCLPTTKSGINVLNVERVALYQYLLNKPISLMKLMKQMFDYDLELELNELNDINSLELELENNLDVRKVKVILKYLLSINYLSVNLHKSNGFTYYLSDKGEEASIMLTSGYFQRLESFLDVMKKLQSKPINKIRENIKRISDE